jgi:hypothetical protein
MKPIRRERRLELSKHTIKLLTERQHESVVGGRPLPSAQTLCPTQQPDPEFTRFHCGW